MKVNVVSKYKGNGFRTVEIPEDELNEKTTLEETLDLVVRFGQNEYQHMDYPSVGSGDIIVLHGKYHIVENYVFKEVSEALFMQLRKKYQKMEAELNLNAIYNEINSIYADNGINAS